ncbi:hypothetical protein EYC58_02040 [Candidatus Saccharibacteria bacterium]|nr:MAG: hypothetical protein EYC58_02040 [Candidatus Saccharibacteria bacterium]
MADYATKEDLEQLRSDIRQDIQDAVTAATEQTINDLSEVIQQLAFSMSEQIREVKVEIADLRASIDRLTNTMDKFAARLDAQELEAAAQDARFARLLDWAREVSKKTGIPLKDL